jgi:hypothetical protein
MFASQRTGEVDFSEFGKIRCCTFRTRSLWYLTSEYMHGEVPAVVEQLLCIDLSHRKFKDANFVVDISFVDYLSFSDRGVLSENNYDLDLEFGLSDKFLASLIARNLDFDLKIMAKVDIEARPKIVYIEARPKGRQEGTAIEDYVVEEQGDRVLKTFKTQAEAITWAKGQGRLPHVARVRHLNDQKIPDHWRPV